MYKVKRHDGQVEVVGDAGKSLYLFEDEGWVVWKKSEGVAMTAHASLVKNLTDEELLKALATLVTLGA